MHIQNEVNHIFRIPVLLLHVSALYKKTLRVFWSDRSVSDILKGSFVVFTTGCIDFCTVVIVKLNVVF
jgi:hypothetical protein